MKKFDIPSFYRSSIIGEIKEGRRVKDRLKKDFSPTKLDFTNSSILLARHFGFCYGVENAVEIAYKTLDEFPDKRIFFLSEMIHNPDVNKDLLERGVSFILDTYGKQLIPWEKISEDDIGLNLEIVANIKVGKNEVNVEKKFTKSWWMDEV